MSQTQLAFIDMSFISCLMGIDVLALFYIRSKYAFMKVFLSQILKNNQGASHTDIFSPCNVSNQYAFQNMIRLYYVLKKA